MLKNYMEILVDHIMISLLAEPEYANICKCEQCVDDIRAIALNNLKPKYIASHSGMIYTKIQELRVQGEVDALAALIKAIQIVDKQPRH